MTRYTNNNLLGELQSITNPVCTTEGVLEDSLKCEFTTYLAHYGNRLDVVADAIVSPNSRQPHHEYEESDDSSVYTGKAGLALIYYRFLKRIPETFPVSPGEANRKRFYGLLHRLSRSETSGPTFYCGKLGVLTMRCIGASVDRKDAEVEKLLVQIADFAAETLKSPQLIQHGNCTAEFLYGYAGVLYALLFLRAEVSSHQILSDKLITELCNKIIAAGIASREIVAQSDEFTELPPLVFVWHGKAYIGAAHGTAGILYLLLYCRRLLDDHSLYNLILPTLDYILDHRLPSGNILSSLARRNNDLVQWCHGAPGLVQTCLEANALSTNEPRIIREPDRTQALDSWKKHKQKYNYLEEAVSFGDFIWERGLLTKGGGLCHGICGNAYSFLSLFKVTGNEEHLKRAIAFFRFYHRRWKGEGHSADRPFSLMEGLGGVVCFLQDILTPREACFPGYELTVTC